MRSTNKNRNGTTLFVLIFLFPFLCSAETPQFNQPDVRLEHSEILARGRQETVFHVSRYGRYAITVSSKQGTALQLVDHMAGPGKVSGIPGEVNGRIDAFLDRGSYKIIAISHERGNGKAALQVHSFHEQNSPKPPLLEDLKMLHDSLGDFEQISYWLMIPTKRNVVLEAAGRNLADLRLWKHGTWLIDAAPKISVKQPKMGQPILTCLLTAELDAGLYLLTAYGGSSQPWSIETKEHPFHLRFGIPTLGIASRKRFITSPFGVDRFLVPGSATYFRLELAEQKFASLQVGWFNEKELLQNSPLQTITKKSVLPVAELQTEQDSKRHHLVNIESEPGQPYILQHFELSYSYNFSGNGNYWLSTVHSGHPSDSVDATAIVMRNHLYEDFDQKAFLSEVIQMDSSHDWKRRFNLLERLTLFLRIHETGKYEIISEGVKAKFRIEPFLITTTPEYRRPPFQESGSTWDLDSGYYVLTVEPVQKGILTMHFRAKGLINSIREAVGLGTETEPVSARAAVRFEQVSLDLASNYCIYLNRQPEVKAGVILRKLPLDPTEPLFISLQPGETASVQIQVGSTGILKSETEVGTFLQLAKGQDTNWKKELDLMPGRYDIKIRNHYTDTVLSSLFFESRQRMATTPLPSLPDSALQNLPNFPEVGETQQQYFDLTRNEEKPFLLKASQPALYQVQTTGLLSTSGNLRTRINPSFLRESSNGIGRNFLIQQYLREGDYQITVSTQGASQGHAGLQLIRTTVRDGGLLTEDLPARVSLAAGDAVWYQFTIREAGTYRLQSFGIGRTFLCRLEDADGWPIERPNIPADFTRHFDTGTYRLILLPDPVSTRRITLLHRIVEPVRLNGHGPHQLVLDKLQEHVWLESNQTEKRIPDIWKLSVPAPINAEITLTGEMHGDLILMNQNGARTKVAYVPPERGWKGHLEMGEYQLEVSCVRRNNQVSYAVRIQTEQLVPGLEREAAIPGIVSISVGQERLVELTSFGSIDLRASLRDISGRLIARNDDRPEDWNFHIARTLKPGKYQLYLDPVGSEGGTVTISMSAPDEIIEQALALPAKMQLDSLSKVHLYPLQLPADADLLLISATSAETVGCSLEVRENESWRSLGTREDHVVHLEIPLPSLPGLYRMRIWSVDRRGTPLHISTTAIRTKQYSEKQFMEGIIMKAVPGIEPPVAAMSVRVNGAGSFRIIERTAQVRWCSELYSNCQPNSALPASVTGKLLWIISDLPKGREEATIRGFREILASGKNLRIRLSATPATVDLTAAEPGLVLMRATALSGQPALRILNRKNLVAEFEPEHMAVARRSAVALSLDSQNLAAQLWQASEETDPVEAEIYQHTFNRVSPEDASWGTWSIEMKGLSARRYLLPPGKKRLNLTLGPTVVAALMAATEIESLHWANEEPLQETIHTSAEELLLFHTRESADPLTCELLPAKSVTDSLSVSFEQPYEQVHSTQNTIRLKISDGGDHQMLQIGGAARNAVLIRKDGKIFQGLELPTAGEGGIALIEYNPGLVLAWLEKADKTSGLWGMERQTESLKLDLPSTVNLAGSIQSYVVATRKPSILHVRTLAAVMIRLERKNRKSEVQVYEKGCNLDTYLPDGNAQLTLRALSGENLWGTMEVSTSQATNIVEGLGKKVLLPSGSTHFFSFSVARESSVGMGVRADSGVVEATVWDSSGQKLGRGVVQMISLKPGSYFLSVHIPKTSAPVSIQPALAGLDIPSTDPPEEVVRNYLQLSKPATPGDSTPFIAAPETRPINGENSYDDRYNADEEE